jgi:hypothetical protein
MTELVVRRLLIDLEAPIACQWNGGDAFRTAFFNALSMSFPRGEQFFIDSVRAGLKALPEAERAVHAVEVQGFIGQEATHRRLHALFNAHLERQGHVNRIDERARVRIESHAHLDLRNHLAATAATEHFTALFADWMLTHAEALEGAEPRLQTLWLWHSAEEAEHRCTAFDMYHAAGGNHAWRVRVFKAVTVIFLGDLLRQTLRNLRHDGALLRWSTWRSAWQLLFKRDGLLRGNVGLWREYLRADFHPSQHDASRAQQWLRENSAQFTVVGQPA